jgi:hypothetical protein
MLRLQLITTRGLTCEYCKTRVARAEELTLHHIKELTPENVHDATVALNPDNLMLVHHGCHNRIHRRGRRNNERQVFIVYGPPMAGKKTYVQGNMEPGDLVVDIDAIYVSLSTLSWYNKPEGLLPIARGLYNQTIDYIKTRYGRWSAAWIIGGFPDRYKRDKLASDLGAELIFMDTTRTECITRLAHDDGRHDKAEEWKRYIDRWFEEYTPSLLPPVS